MPDIREEFMVELRALLAKYDADISADDYYDGYPECGQDVRMIVGIPTKWDGDGNVIRAGAEINLGRLVDATEPPEGET